MNSEKIRVVIAEDNQDLCNLLRLVIEAEADMHCVGATDSLDEIAPLTIRQAAELVVLDVELQGKSSLRALQTLRSKCPDTHFLMYTGHAHPQMREAALAAGACDYVLKSGDMDDLLAAIRSARQRQPPAAD